VTIYRCSGCGMANTAINDLQNMAHTRTGGKPSGCRGRWLREEGVEEVVLFESA
jgi:hypothetical protein